MSSLPLIAFGCYDGPMSNQVRASSALFLNNKGLVWQIHNLGVAYGSRPSEIVGVLNSWAAFQFDVAVLVFGRWVENRRADGENVLALLSEDYGKGSTDAADARFVAGMLGIPFYALDFQADFDWIIDYFADEYVRGRTPNPCVVCNARLKFGKLVDYADAVGAKYIATGHYARIARHNGCNVLMRGRDPQKDQSYALFGLDRSVLDRVIFPVGELTKGEVRGIATRLNLPNRDKPDSVEICFVPDRDYARLVRERRPEAFIVKTVVEMRLVF